MRSYTVLIVEDEAIVAMDIEERLKQMGYQVSGTAASAREALALIGETRPDLILMDIQIQGDFDGIQTAKHVLASHDIPVIFLTANSDPQTLDRVRQVGPFGYLLKPFEERELAMAIDVAIYRHETEKELRHSREWFVTTLRCIGDGVIATDATNRVKFMNPAAEQLTWTKGIEVIGRPLDEVFHLSTPEGHRSLTDVLAEAGKTGIPVGVDGSKLTCSALREPLLVNGSVTRINDSRSVVLGVIIVFRAAKKTSAEDADSTTEEVSAVK